MTPLSKTHPTAEFELGDMLACYLWSAHHDAVEFYLIPLSKQEKRIDRRGQDALPHVGKYGAGTCWGNRIADSLVQVALRHEVASPMWGNGQTMRNGQTTQALSLQNQTVEMKNSEIVIRTILETPEKLRAIHTLVWRQGVAGVLISTALENHSEAPCIVEHLSSFCLNKLSPFAIDDMPHRLNLHRFQTAWSNEGRHECRSIEELHLERTWGDGGINVQRFGQVGSMPVRGYFPFVALEDKQEQVFWGAKLAWHGSWQMEVYRRDDPIHLAGGHADYVFGQWAHTLQPGARLESLPAILSTGVGCFDDFCHRLVQTEVYRAHPEPECEAAMPVIFNEWASTWGHPTHDYLLKTGEKLKDTGVGYIVIDDGWAVKPKGVFQVNGDWELNQESFPQGLGATALALREMGFIPGIWFEFEVATTGTKAYSMTDHQLKRHGKTLQVGSRHFWDFRDPWTIDYLTEKVIRLLKDNHLGYLKVDYNDSIGLGCDPLNDEAQALGEGLRQHLLAVHGFFQKIREELPELVIENCSSGGHRLESGMVGLTSMSSFSDAHETIEIPVIAANLLRIIPLHKNQIWAVMRPKDDRQRTIYSLTAAMLGRMVISGDVVSMNDESFSLLKEALSFYNEALPRFRGGKVRLHREMGTSYRYPEGWQGVTVESADAKSLLAIFHTFEKFSADRVAVPVVKQDWKQVYAFGDFESGCAEGMLTFKIRGDFQAGAVLYQC